MWFSFPYTRTLLPSHWLPADSPLHDPLLTYAFCISLLLQHSLFHILSSTIFSGSAHSQLKKRCWILTTFNAGVTTLASLPYLYDFFSHGLDFGAIQRRREFTHAMCAFFVAYLASDLGLGSIYYRKLINLSSGWIHHTVYLCLFTFWVHKGWGHIAVMACVFELPTFVMGIASLHPPLRSNVAFTSTFFLTRVFFHIALLATSITEHGRSAPGIDGSWGPCISVAVTLPMHLWWGWKCILSVRRRMFKRKMAAKAEREKQANQFANIAAQAFNGFQAPDTSSAVNTPLPTPGPSPLLTATTSAFAKAAAAAAGKRPMSLVLGRAQSASNLDSIPPLEGMSSPMISGTSSLQVPVRPEMRMRRCSADAVRPARHLTAPVRPEGATDDSREPFLAIRSAAEARDRARRLVADAVRRIWFGAPESWRRQFEEEALQMELRRQPRRAKTSLAETSERSDTDGEGVTRRGLDTADGEEDDSEAARATAEQRSRGQKARALLQRGILRAVRRAINGKASSSSSSSSSFEATDGPTLGVPDINADSYSQSDDEVLTRRNKSETDRALSNLDLISIFKLSGLPLPPDLTGDPYEVRPLNVERREGERRRRFVEGLRRQMEVRARDVVVWDD